MSSCVDSNTWKFNKRPSKRNMCQFYFLFAMSTADRFLAFLDNIIEWNPVFHNNSLLCTHDLGYIYTQEINVQAVQINVTCLVEVCKSLPCHSLGYELFHIFNIYILFSLLISVKSIWLTRLQLGHILQWDVWNKQYSEERLHAH